MNALTSKLLNDFQHTFPLSPEPYEQIARKLCTSSSTVLDTLRALQISGVISRVGPVFRPNTVGASTLAAMAVHPDKLEQVAAIINTFPEVNHNYEREHRFNLWFVVTAADRNAVESTLQTIGRQAGYRVMSLPLVKDYHIDLGFSLPLNDDIAPSIDAKDVDESGAITTTPTTPLAGCAEDLIEVVQDGLPLVPRPYRDIAARLGCTEDEVIAALHTMLVNGTIKRLGVVVRHRELGYRANAMVVWDVPDTRIDDLGERLGGQDCVTLCYQRPRRLPEWPYNLFCMVHGRDRGAVLDCIERVAETTGIADLPHAILFSGRRFRQRGARYRIRR